MSSQSIDITKLSKTFSPEEIENKWYKIWEDGKYFKPKKGKTGKSYTIVMPLPNVTGKLHIGHALDVTTQDASIRFKRMKGYETLWLPATDHAGISTQAVVERLVYEQEGKTRHDFSKEEFVKKIWDWKNEYGNIIVEQQRAIGASPDWDYAMFTLDEDANKAVKKFFVEMYNEGLIYQADYIINWDPVLQSAISDAEVEHEEIKGSFYHVLYSVEGSDEKIEIATTRPETMLGDTAVAINPKDNRFKHLLGKKAIVPICNRSIPIIADEHVDIEKGTGCLKVTPGHDFYDFDIGKRHNLEIINILNKDGTLNQYGLEYKGLSCIDARSKIVEKLKTDKILVDVKEHVHQVGHSERSKAVVEPLVSKQWFLNVQDMAKVALDKIISDDPNPFPRGNATKFYPDGWKNTYNAWLKEPKNWCISRQLWWGHQIPVYYCEKCKNTWASETNPNECIKCNSSDVTQDPDVLDTWFSSGLWPLTMLGWPDKKRMKERGFDRFYPTSTLITGYDIIFFWVARMMMMCSKASGKVPFDHVYIHALVRDKFGRKMSKSLNNGIDPLDMVKKYGADSLRFSLTAGSGYNRGLNLDPERIDGYRNFINKVWNAFRFIAPFLGEAKNELPRELSVHEKWILNELNMVTETMNKQLEIYRYDDASSAIYSFVYDKFCSWFIELSKSTLYGENQLNKIKRATVLKFVFRKIVALMHPFTPYITEEIWSHLKEDNEDLLIIQDYPRPSKDLDFSDEWEPMNKFIETISAIRNLRTSVNIKPKDTVEIELFTEDQTLEKYFSNNMVGLKELGKVHSLIIKAKTEKRPEKSIMNITSHTEIFLPLANVDDLESQIVKLKNSLQKAEKEYSKFNNKLSNSKFIDNAPNDIIMEVKHKALETLEKVNSIKENIKRFEC